MVVVMEKGEASGKVEQTGPKPTSDLKGEDIDGMFVAKNEVELLKEGSKWMAVMRILTTQPFSATYPKKTMRFVWAPAQEVSFRDIEENRFPIQENCLGIKKITEQGPWLFRDHSLLIQKYDGNSSDATVKLNRIDACTKIHDVSQLYRK
jgi:hypothetical protein